MGYLAAAAGLLAVVTGWLPWREAGAVTAHVAPVLAFLVAITVLAELADAAGVFDAAANRVARLSGGSTRRLFLLVVALGTVTTVLLSLDTTAVLLTPVVLALTQTLGLAPLPFALSAVWLANAASLLLPVSNLTNLLAFGQLHVSVLHFAARMGLPELAAVGVSTAVLLVRFRGELRGHFPAPQPWRPPDRLLFAVAAVSCAALGPAVLAGVAPYAAASGAAGATVAAFAARRPSQLRPRLVPWQLLLLTEGLFLVVTALGQHGLDRWLRLVAGGSATPVGVLRTAVTGALAGNAVNNLPAYLALQRALRGAPEQLFGLLLGTNTGPLVLLYGSLATLLWRDRCRARGLKVSAWQFARLGLVVVPLLLLTTWLALEVTA